MRSVGTNSMVKTAATIAAVLLAVLVVAGGVDAAQMETPQQVKATCVKAGLKKPDDLKGSFYIQVYEHSTAPHAGLEHKALTMPDACAGRYRRFFFVNFRYQTTGKGWRTFHGFGYQPGKPRAWVLISNENTGTGVLPNDPTPVALYSEISSLEATKTKNPAPWGKVQQVKGRVRMWVKDEATGKIVGGRIYRIRTKFCRAPVHNDHACAL